MTGLDIILLIILIPSAIQGFRKGFVVQLAAVLSIIVGAWLSYRFASALSSFMSQHFGMQEPMLRLLAFVAIFCIVIVLFALLGKLLKAVVKIALLGWLDKLLGVIFGLLKAMLVVCILVSIFNNLNNCFNIVDMEYIFRSRVYCGLLRIAETVFPYLRSCLTLL